MDQYDMYSCLSGDVANCTLFQSLLYEACGRTINPVYGSAGLLWSGSWHLCEAAVDAVLRGVNLQPVPPALLSVQTPATPPPLSAPASSPPPEVAFHAPPSQPSRQQTPDMKSRQGHANNAAAMPSFPFHMMDPTAMAYWPLAMAPMMGAHMAAMGSTGYQPAYPTGAPQYAPNDANMPAKPQHQQQQQIQQQQQQQQIQQQQQQQQIQQQQIQQEGNHMWMPPDVSKGQGGQQSTGPGAQHMYEHHTPQSGICSPSGGTSSEACSPMHLAAAPLVAPVARRLTPQSGPFMLSVNTGNGHGVSMVGSEGHPTESSSSVGLMQEDVGVGMSDWVVRAGAGPPSHALLPLMGGGGGSKN